MRHYINLLFQADEEVPIYFIRNKVFTKLHKTLHDQKQTSIGVSFPNHKAKLGDIIRLHGDKTSLETLQKRNWLGGLSGYCRVSNILPVPDKVEGYRTVSRIRQNMTNAKLRRLIQRGSISEDETRGYQAKMMAGSLDDPFLELRSKSTSEKYRIYIVFGALKDQPAEGDFNHFGLSKTATVPWF